LQENEKLRIMNYKSGDAQKVILSPQSRRVLAENRRDSSAKLSVLRGSSERELRREQHRLEEH